MMHYMRVTGPIASPHLNATQVDVAETQVRQINKGHWPGARAVLGVGAVSAVHVHDHVRVAARARARARVLGSRASLASRII